jgi:hypothetical protein
VKTRRISMRLGWQDVPSQKKRGGKREGGGMGWGRVRSKDAQELCQLIRMILFAVMRAVVYFIDATTPSFRWKIRNFPFPALSARHAILGLRGTSSSRCRLRAL